MKWPFVSRKRFDDLQTEHTRLKLDMDDMIDRVNEDHEETERTIRKLQDELYHARHAIFNTKRMQQYEEMMLRSAELNRPHPADVLRNVMAMTDATKEEIQKVSRIDAQILGLKPEDGK